MKCHRIITQADIRREAEREVLRRYDQMQQDICEDFATQLMSNILLVLDKTYGWRGKRLNDFVEAVVSFCEVMNNPTALNHRFTADDNYHYLIKKYNLDVKKKLRFNVKGASK